MKNRRKLCMIIAAVIVAAIIISGVTVAAVTFGLKVKEKQDTHSHNDYMEYGGGYYSEEDNYDDYTSDYTENESDETSVLPEDIGSVPYAIQSFAEKNGLSTDLWPKELIELIKKNPETEEFVLNYPLLKDEEFYIDISDSANSDSVPLFLQWDKRWGYTPYGDDMIANAGCGPTCLSMVYTYLTGDTYYDPKTMAEFSEDYGYCVPGNGSAWSLISEGGEILGLNVEELPLDEDMIRNSLLEGNPVICVMGPGDFTDGGHFIVMTDYIDGKIKINDPNSVIRSEKLWNFDDIKYQIENLWACSAY